MAQWHKIIHFQNEAAQPSPRRAHSAAAVGTHSIVVWGGRGKDSKVSGMSVLELPNTWQTPHLEGAAPTLRYNHTASTIGKRIYFFGGENEQTLYNDINILDMENMRWVVPKVKGTPPCPRYAHTACVYEHLIVIFGGSSSPHLNDVHVFDTDEMEWSGPVNTQGSAPSPRCGHAAAVVRSHMYVFGGLSQTFLNDLFALNLETMVWTAITATGRPCSIRGHLTVNCFGSHLLFFGGWNGSTYVPQLLNDVHILSVGEHPLEAEWSHPVVEGTPPCPRNTHTATLLGNRIYVIGGWDRKTCFNDVHVLNLDGILQHLNTKRFFSKQVSMLNQARFSDVTFCLDDKTIHAHRAILAAQSEFFMSLFSSGMKESTDSVIRVDKICGGHRPSYNAFLSFLQYLYTGQPAAQLDTLCELMALSDYYHDPTMTEWTMNHFRSAPPSFWGD